jgi:protein-disulfide isomerase
MPQVVSVGAVAGIGFTVSLFIAELALTDEAVREEAKVGILAAAVAATVLGWLLFRLPTRRAQTAPAPELRPPADPVDEHALGPADAPVVLVQFGDYQCPYCRDAMPRLSGLLRRHPQRLRYVWRHLPLDEVHPYARRAAQAAEAAALQGAFWPMHERLLTADDVGGGALAGLAEAAGLDPERLLRDAASAEIAARVEADVHSARDSGVDGTPTFFLDGRRVDGSLDDVITAVERALGAVPV